MDKIKYSDLALIPGFRGRPAYQWHLVGQGRDVLVDLSGENLPSVGYDFRDRSAVLRDKLVRLKSAARAMGRASGLEVVVGRIVKPYETLTLRFEKR